MLFDDFKDQYDGAPYSLEDVAWAARQVEDNPKLQRAGSLFFAASEEFAAALEEANIEIG